MLTFTTDFVPGMTEYRVTKNGNFVESETNVQFHKFLILLALKNLMRSKTSNIKKESYYFVFKLLQ